MKLGRMLDVSETFTTIRLSRSSEVRVKVRRWPQSPIGTIYLQAGCPSCRPTNSVKALKAVTSSYIKLKGKQSIAVCSKLHTLWELVPKGITQSYLPPSRCDISTFTPAN